MAPPNRRLIEAGWKRYQSKALDPIQANAIQRRETRIAFYMGAIALFEGILTNLTPGQEPMEPDLALMDGVQEEIKEFAESMVDRGRP